MARPPRGGCKDKSPVSMPCLVYLAGGDVKDTYLEGVTEGDAFNLGRTLYENVVKVVFKITGNEFKV